MGQAILIRLCKMNQVENILPCGASGDLVSKLVGINKDKIKRKNRKERARKRTLRRWIHQSSESDGPQF